MDSVASRSEKAKSRFLNHVSQKLEPCWFISALYGDLWLAAFAVPTAVEAANRATSGSAIIDAD